MLDPDDESYRVQVISYEESGNQILLWGSDH